MQGFLAHLVFLKVYSASSGGGGDSYHAHGCSGVSSNCTGGNDCSTSCSSGGGSAVNRQLSVVPYSRTQVPYLRAYRVQGHITKPILSGQIHGRRLSVYLIIYW